MSFSEIEGYAALNLWQEAWEAIEDLPTNIRSTSQALRWRLRCCIELDGWGMGANIAEMLAEGEEADRMAAAGFYHELAVHEFLRDEADFAKAAIRRAIAAYPACRIKILDDPRLENLI